jgi:hypothetical protein
MASKGGKNRIPNWLIGRRSDFKGIWIPYERPVIGRPGAKFRSWPTPFGRDWEWKLVRDLFKAHELDPANPIHWQRLILIFANEHRSRQPGAKTLWTEDRLCQVAAAFELAQGANPGESDSYICKLLAAGKFKLPARHPGSVALTDLSWGRIRRVLPEARKRLAELIAALVRLVRHDFEPWTAAHEAKVRAVIVKKLAAGGHPHSFLRRLDALSDSLR